MRCSVFGCEVKAIVCLVKVTFIFLLKWRTIFLLRGEFDKQEVGVAGIFFFPEGNDAQIIDTKTF